MKLAGPSQEGQPYFPMSGTNRAAPMSRRSSSSPRFVKRARICSSRSPIGISNRPPSASCSASGVGTAGDPAVTRIALYGAYSRQPSVPSPESSDTLVAPAARIASRACVTSVPDSLDREHLRRQMRKQHRLVAGPRSDLEHPLLSREREQLEIPRMRARLRDRLPIPNRERAVLVRAVSHARGHEEMPRRLIEGVEHGEIAHAPLLQRLDEATPPARLFAAHGSDHQSFASSSMRKCVRSRVRGVTEM